MARHPWVAEADRGIRWGVQLIVPNRPNALPDLLETGRLVERLGYDAIFIFDHPAVHVDPWIALSGLAVAADRVRLGSAVNCVGYRHPAMLARIAADLDNLSRGRLILGIGSGWWDAEHAAVGAPFPPLRQRQAMLDEALQIVTGAWGDEPFSFDGHHVRTEQFRVEPPPLQHPRPPIMIGGSGERFTLRQVAWYGDACNVREPDPLMLASVPVAERVAAVRQKLDALARHCADLGRPPEEVLRTHFTLYLMLAPTEAEAAHKLDAFDASASTSPGTRRSGKGTVFAAAPERAAAYYRALAAIGIQYFIVQLDADDHETITLLAQEVVPRVTTDT
jgi:alkanesulfonate monooxygenase SsuD/methylene tetrahydromethanopterin reductase-like flavin-dependent oxidoreductase (luciferase family)